MNTRLNDLPGDTIVLTDEDYARSFRPYDSTVLPDPNGDCNAIVLVNAIGLYPAGTRLIVDASSSGIKTWVPVGGGVRGVGAPSNVRSYQLVNSQDVFIRWDDPDDTSSERWKYTRVLRKLGSYPTSYRDGVVVVDNSVRNYYSSRVLTDTLPPNITGTWYYRIYAVSENEVTSTDKNCMFTPVELDWKNISTYIQQGRAPSIFGVGDSITLTGLEGTPYENLELIVVGMDQSIPRFGELKHSVTFMTRYLIDTLPFDTGWGRYKLVDDEVVVPGAKTYYEKTADGSGYKVCRPQPTGGYHITKQDGYYYKVPDSIAKYGQNRWKDSKLREWVNATAEYEYSRTNDKVWQADKVYARLNSNGTYTEIKASDVAGVPVDNGLYERGNRITFFSGAESEQVEPLMSALQRTYPDFANLITWCTNHTALTEDLRSGGTYTSDTTYDMVWIPSRSEVTGSDNGGVTEGQWLTYFKEDVNRRGRVNRATSSYATWWLRSPLVDNDVVTHASSSLTLKTVGVPRDNGQSCPIEDTTMMHDADTPTVTRGICLMFAIA